jgi:hypothetical protein
MARISCGVYFIPMHKENGTENITQTVNEALMEISSYHE